MRLRILESNQAWGPKRLYKRGLGREIWSTIGLPGVWVKVIVPGRMLALPGIGTVGPVLLLQIS